MSQDQAIPTTSLRAMRADDWTQAHARHLLWRAGFGGTPTQVEFLARLSPEKAVAHLVDLEKVQGYPEPAASDFDQAIMRPPSADDRAAYQRARRSQDEDFLAKVRLDRQRREQEDRAQVQKMQRWWLKRMIETPRPLEEKLTLFWHGHFATSYRTIENSYHMYLQNQLFRAHAAGNFGELLFAIIRDPAMLAYLDNNDSTKTAPNENLSRELMELFSLGEGAYTERDIKEGARALTGYSFDFNSFVFRADRHDAGSKSILGATGPLDGDAFVKAILSERACAEFIAAKIYRYFVADIPEPGAKAHAVVAGFVRQLASTLLSSRYEIRPVLRRLFLSEHFYDPVNRLARVKSPVELVVGAVRSLQTPVRDLGILLDAMDLMGQAILFPPSVKGWDGGRSWINSSTMFVRENILNFLLTGKTPHGYDPLAHSEPYDPTPLLAELTEQDSGADRDPLKVAPFLLEFAFGRAGRERQIQTIGAYIAEVGGRQVTPEAVTGALALITSLPEYQLV